MINQKRIKHMIKLAVYEKNLSLEDKKVENYFKSDYVYINNWKIRVIVTIVFIIIMGWEIFNKVYNKGMNIIEMDFRTLILKIIFAYGIIIFAFSILSSFVYSRRYNQSQKRLDKYYEELKKIESYTENKE